MRGKRVKEREGGKRGRGGINKRGGERRGRGEGESRWRRGWGGG